ncbi:CRISPR-associated protein Cas4 [bacterium]|nr:MAG: CRISPR-associated protein Cas4 [bacterium]
MFTEDDFILISALQHYVYCPRQCGLIHVEDVWRENVFTVRGDILHDKVDTDTFESRGALRTVRGLRIHSYRLGIVGRADVVEFRKSKGADEGQEVMPVEYKAGEPKEDLSDKVQLCAQALCLEEMLNLPVPRGSFFYGKIRRRVDVDIDAGLRQRTEEIISAIRDLVTRKHTPAAEYGDKCRHCSLEPLCLPKGMNQRKLKQYMEGLYLQ